MQARHEEATYAYLTVRTANAAARSLYASLGFTKERLLLPMGRDFTLTSESAESAE